MSFESMGSVGSSETEPKSPFRVRAEKPAMSVGYETPRSGSKEAETYSAFQRNEMMVANVANEIGVKDRRDWRAMLVPGGLRLMAHERFLTRRLDMRKTVLAERSASAEIKLGVKETSVTDLKETSVTESMLDVFRRFIIILELLRYRLSRILILRIAGLKLSEQRKFEQVFLTSWPLRQLSSL